MAEWHVTPTKADFFNSTAQNPPTHSDLIDPTCPKIPKIHLGFLADYDFQDGVGICPPQADSNPPTADKSPWGYFLRSKK